MRPARSRRSQRVPSARATAPEPPGLLPGGLSGMRVEAVQRPSAGRRRPTPAPAVQEHPYCGGKEYRAAAATAATAAAAAEAAPSDQWPVAICGSAVSVRGLRRASAERRRPAPPPPPAPAVPTTPTTPAAPAEAASTDEEAAEQHRMLARQRVRNFQRRVRAIAEAKRQVVDAAAAKADAARRHEEEERRRRRDEVYAFNSLLRAVEKRKWVLWENGFGAEQIGGV
eukprot:TRINITY_DN7015_c1_g1_i3.p2 TRINITY_DN7015_c1_g1~~TRINITY_DN7015_c1_g1_i3.p2  ORF type:complete len:255 (+),score=92.74 TRINITY_DN7015_c1_g1_i3:85-765(+)